MPVIDIARTDVVQVAPSESLVAVAETLRSESVGCVVAVEDGAPVGVVTDRDLAMAVLDTTIDPATTTVDQLLTDSVTTIDASAGVYKLLQRMSNRGIRQVPVVDDDTLVGIVTLSDIVVLLGMELQHVANTIRADAPAYQRSATEIFE